MAKLLFISIVMFPSRFPLSIFLLGGQRQKLGKAGVGTVDIGHEFDEVPPDQQKMMNEYCVKTSMTSEIQFQGAHCCWILFLYFEGYFSPSTNPTVVVSWLLRLVYQHDKMTLNERQQAVL